MIIHVLPENIEVCGGIKVHYDLCELERKLGIESIIAFPDRKKIPTWLSRNIKPIFDYRTALSLAYEKNGQAEPIIVIGWEDPNILQKYFSKFLRFCYIQGDVYWQGKSSYISTNTRVICSNYYIQNKINVVNAPIISPAVDDNIFYPSNFSKFFRFPYTVLIQERKGGREALEKIKSFFPNKLVEENFNFKILPNVNEIEFAKKLRETDIFISHSYPEGFGLPALEAMASGTLVVGFSGGGGTEFMKNKRNCFYADDGNYEELSKILQNILNMTSIQLTSLLNDAYDTSKIYTKDRMMKQLINFLKLIPFKQACGN